MCFLLKLCPFVTCFRIWAGGGSPGTSQMQYQLIWHNKCRNIFLHHQKNFYRKPDCLIPTASKPGILLTTFPSESGQTNVPRRNYHKNSREGRQANCSKGKMPSRSFRTKVPKILRNPSGMSLAAVPKLNIPSEWCESERCHARVPGKRIQTDSSETTFPKRSIPNAKDQAKVHRRTSPNRGS